MPKRRRAVLLCGQARATLAAVARGLASANVPLVIQAAPAEVAATRRLCRLLMRDTGGARVVGGVLGGDVESPRLVAQAWKAARAIDAVVICPPTAVAGAAADPGLGAWHDGLEAGLRAPFFLAKHAGLRLARAGGGRLVLAIGASTRGGEPIASVVRSGLLCMVDALTRALSREVAVTAVVGSGGATARERAEIARGVRFFIEGSACASGTVIELGARPRRG